MPKKYQVPFVILKAIGVFRSSQIEPYQAGRQPDEIGAIGEIKLVAGENFEQALQDLIGCSHVWLIFGFHKNTHWKPLVQTPRSTQKIGVFATRAPYRPNPLGLSLVKLIDIVGLKIQVAENDLLDGSPIYDIKPYHPEADFAAEAHIEWLENSQLKKFEINFSPVADEHFDWLEQNHLSALQKFVRRQLEYDPLNKNKKRVQEKTGYWTLSYRTWRIDFSVTENTVTILLVRSGYTEAELQSDEDPYLDKDLHRQFKKIF